MKIQHSDMIRIARKEAVMKIIGTMKAGDRVPARITDRQGRYFATIDVRGRHLKAEFPGGVPGSNHLTLQLVKKEGDSILFRLIQASNAGGLKEKVSQFVHLPSSLMNTLTPAHLNAALADVSSLLELNIFLLNPERKERIRGEGITALLNRLMTAGIPQQSLVLITSLLEEHLMAPGMLNYLMGLLGQRQKKKNSQSPEREADELIQILNEALENTDTIERESLFERFFHILTQEREPIHGEIPLPVEDGFLPLKVLRGEDAWLFSLEFTSLGTIDIIAWKKGPLNLYADSSEKLEMIQKELQELPEGGFAGVINFLLKQDAFDKLVAINTFFSFNSQLDIKV